MSYLSDLTCHTHYLAFSWVQFYDILQMLFVICCFLSMSINTRFMELIAVFQNYFVLSEL